MDRFNNEEMTEETKVAALDFLSFFYWLWPYLRPYRRMGLILLCGLLLETGFETFMRISSKYLIDEAIIPQNYSLLIIILASLGLGAVISSGAAFYCDYLWARLAAGVMNLMRENIFSHLQKLSMNYFARVRTGDLMTRFSTDLASIEYGLVYSLPSGLIAFGGLILSAAFLFSIEWRLALVTCIGLPFCFLAQKLFGKQAVEADIRHKEAQSRLASTLQENLSAQQLVKAFSLQQKAMADFQVKLGGLFTTGIRSNFITFLFQRTPIVSAQVLSILILGIGALLCFQGSLSIGSLVAFQVLLTGMNTAVTTFTWVLPTLIAATGGMIRIRKILDEQPLVIDAPDASPVTSLDADIEFRNVSFQYSPDQRGLDDVSALLTSGAHFAFVGSSGSGKSTMMSLLLRFYDPAHGSILLGDRDIRTFSLESLRARMGIVFQENFLLNISIRENIRMGKLEASDQDIEAAARLAEIHEYIVNLPHGYESLAGERGSNLSGGQRQRIAIARALVRKPQILLLDEATSALDPETESAINATLERISKGYTIISVTHRLSTVTNLDRILVFEQGQMVEQGIHDELVRKGGPYSQLWKKQAGFAADSTGEHFKVDLSWLKELPFFKDVPPVILEDVANLFITERIAENRMVIFEGDSGDRFYIIVRGRVLVDKEPKTSEDKSIILADGDYFGEIALLKNVPRTASVRTLTPCLLLTLGQEQFHHLMDRVPDLRTAMEQSYLANATPGNAS